MIQPSLQVATALAPLRVLDEDGTPREVGSLWADSPLVLLFLRQFGCVFCQEQASLFQAELPAFTALGARVAAIGLGAPAQARSFRARLKLDYPVFCDPDRTTYDAAQFKRGVLPMLSLQALRNAARVWKAGFRQGESEGDLWQLGGAFVFLPDGRTVLAHLSLAPGDALPPHDALQALRASLR